MTSTWSFTLSFIPLSMNQRERSHYMTRKKELDLITQEVALAKVAKRIPDAKLPRHVMVEIVKGPRSRKRDDPGNRDARAKSIYDALVNTNLLVDDDDEWMTHDPVRESKGDRPHTIIRIMEGSLS